MLDPTQFSNPYLQGNPLVPQLSPEMQAAVRQRSIFNAGAAMLGSAGRGENILSGLSQAGQTYGGSLDAMMREGLQYQAMANKAAHEKELFKLRQDELKQNADIARERNETDIKTTGMRGDTALRAAGMQNALELQRAKREEELYKRSQAIGQSFVKNALQGKGYSFGGNPLSPEAAATLIMREGTPEQQAQYLALTGSADQTRAFAPGRFASGNLLGALGELNIPPTTQGPVDMTPKTFEEYERIKEQNAAAQARTKEFESTVGPASKVSRYLLGPLGGAPQDKWVNMTVDQHNKTKEYIKQNFATLSPQEKELAAEYLDFASSPEKIESFKRMRKAPGPLNPFGGLDKILNYRASQGLPNP